MIADRDYFGREFEAELTDAGLGLACCARPARARRREPAPGSSNRYGRSSSPSTTPSRGQLDLEQHGGRTAAGIWVRVVQRVLALTAALWHNDRTGQPIKRSLLAYDH